MAGTIGNLMEIQECITTTKHLVGYHWVPNHQMKLVQKFYLFAFLGLVFGASGQTLTVELDPIDSVIVGGGFELSGRIVHDGVSPPVTTGTPIQLD